MYKDKIYNFEGSPATSRQIMSIIGWSPSNKLYMFNDKFCTADAIREALGYTDDIQERVRKALADLTGEDILVSTGKLTTLCNKYAFKEKYWFCNEELSVDEIAAKTGFAVEKVKSYVVIHMKLRMMESAYRVLSDVPTHIFLGKVFTDEEIQRLCQDDNVYFDDLYSYEYDIKLAWLTQKLYTNSEFNTWECYYLEQLLGPPLSKRYMDKLYVDFGERAGFVLTNKAYRFLGQDADILTISFITKYRVQELIEIVRNNELGELEQDVYYMQKHGKDLSFINLNTWFGNFDELVIFTKLPDVKVAHLLRTGNKKILDDILQLQV